MDPIERLNEELANELAKTIDKEIYKCIILPILVEEH